jgi:hypothetical protein
LLAAKLLPIKELYTIWMLTIIGTKTSCAKSGFLVL